MILRLSFFERGESREKGLANKMWDTVEDGVDEGGGQRVDVEEVGVMEGCHTLNMRFQCVNGWDQYICKLLYCLQGLIHLAELAEHFAPENIGITKVDD